jgi:hypothetical protein
MEEYVTTEVATVFRYGGRRYLTKRSAFAAKAREWMERDHENVPHEDFMETGEYCRCHFCDDRANNCGKLHKRLTRYLMRKADAAVEMYRGTDDEG